MIKNYKKYKNDIYVLLISDSMFIQGADDKLGQFFGQVIK